MPLSHDVETVSVFSLPNYVLVGANHLQLHVLEQLRSLVKAQPIEKTHLIDQLLALPKLIHPANVEDGREFRARKGEETAAFDCCYC